MKVPHPPLQLCSCLTTAPLLCSACSFLNPCAPLSAPPLPPFPCTTLLAPPVPCALPRGPSPFSYTARTPVASVEYPPFMRGCAHSAAALPWLDSASHSFATLTHRHRHAQTTRNPTPAYARHASLICSKRHRRPSTGTFYTCRAPPAPPFSHPPSSAVPAHSCCTLFGTSHSSAPDPFALVRRLTHHTTPAITPQERGRGRLGSGTVAQPPPPRASPILPNLLFQPLIAKGCVTFNAVPGSLHAAPVTSRC